MKLPANNERAKAYRKEPDGDTFRIIPLSDKGFAEAKDAVSAQPPEHIDATFVWTQNRTFTGLEVLMMVRGEHPKGVRRTHRDEWDERSAVISGLFDVKTVRETGILEVANVRHPLFKSAVTQTLICLHNLLTLINKRGGSTTVHDDRGSAVDLLEVVRAGRNAACHVTSALHQVGPSRVIFCTSTGPDSGMLIQGVRLGCSFADETAIFYGTNPIYLRRDLHAAHDLAISYFDEYLR